ncbi:MAG: patatin-like phospholipase family protein [Ignavibacteriae bacterium]|nr:patatin-like phospholipase family protein [Ignavibacteriota bacterium]MCB9217205.1 patatin-like phospholipase family protein [Ignavibacteria bacterium]
MNSKPKQLTAENTRSDTIETAHKIGLALSGGGFRASAFHLGVLKRLEELRLLDHVSLISTVSGGSITGALYALRCSKNGSGVPGSYPIESLIAEIRPFLQSNLRGKALCGSPLRILRTVGSFFLPWVRRMPLIVETLDDAVFKSAHVSDLPPWIVINATNLTTGKAWKFFHDRAGDFLIGATSHTSEITVATAVGASAAYPVLNDPYPFSTRWEYLRGDLLDDRWERPPIDVTGETSRWRDRFGKREGNVIIPLTDGGVYDNEGLNSLRGAKITHAIVSSVAPPDSNFHSGRELNSLTRVISVMHARLGAVTRQHAHEMTHGVDPTQAQAELREIASLLRQQGEAAVNKELQFHEIADRIDRISQVGSPYRGHQFTTTTQILLHRSDIAKKRFADTQVDPLCIPVEYEGLDAQLVEEISRVRTDLDALEPKVFDLLVAQGYFLTDAYLKLSMPDVLLHYSELTDLNDLQGDASWDWAQQVISGANNNPQDTMVLLRRAASRKIVGNTNSGFQAVFLWINLITTVIIILFLLCYGLYKAASFFCHF